MNINIRPLIKGKVYGFGYRQAQVKNVFMTIKAEKTIEDEIEYSNLQSVLAERANIKMDNHQVFVIECNEKYLVFQFSDWTISIGTDYDLGIW